MKHQTNAALIKETLNSSHTKKFGSSFVDLVSLISFIHTHKTNASSPGIISKLKARRRKKGHVSTELVSPIYQKALSLLVIQQTADYIPLAPTVSHDHPNLQGCLGRCHFHSFSSRGRQGSEFGNEHSLISQPTMSGTISGLDERISNPGFHWSATPNSV